MKRISLLLTLFSIAGFAFGADEAVEIRSVDQRLAGISDPVVKLFFKARLERASGDLKKAIQTAAQVVALHGDRTEWVAKSELLCAELYVELGMLDAADATIRQIQQLYVGMDVAKQADALQLKIETLKESAEREGKDEL
jgi:hypothetical protein